MGYVFADNTASIKELIVVTVLPIIKTNQMQPPLSFLSAQISALQQSTYFLQSYRESLHPDDDNIELIEIEDNGLKLTDKWQMRIAFPVNICASTASTL